MRPCGLTLRLRKKSTAPRARRIDRITVMNPRVGGPAHLNEADLRQDRVRTITRHDSEVTRSHHTRFIERGRACISPWWAPVPLPVIPTLGQTRPRDKRTKSDEAGVSISDRRRCAVCSWVSEAARDGTPQARALHSFRPCGLQA